MLNASDDWKLAFVAAILGEGQISKLASHPESQGIANVLSDLARDRSGRISLFPSPFLLWLRLPKRFRDCVPKALARQLTDKLGV